MEINKVELKPATRFVAPTGTYLISCGEEGDNIITVSAATLTCITPPMVGIAISLQRYSYSLIKDIGEFVLNVPDVSLLKAVDQCGMLSGKDIDKFDTTGLTPVKSSVVKPPMIAECPINIECRVRHRIELGSHDWFIAEIIAVKVREDFVSKDGKLNAHLLKPIVTIFGKYLSVGSKLVEHGHSQHTK